MVRISLGCYNDRSDVDVIVSALEQIIAGDIPGDYRPDIDGSYTPVGYVEPNAVLARRTVVSGQCMLKRISNASPSCTS